VTVAVYLPLLLPILVSALARWAADRARPGVAVRGLVATSAAAAILSVWSLVLLALTLFDDVPPFRTLTKPHLPQPVPDFVAVLALTALAWSLARLGRDQRYRADTVRRLRGSGIPSDGLVVADW
jgi:hypothetical protein